MTTNGRRTGVVCCGRAVLLAAMWTTLVWTCCADAAATAESKDWRPCRAAGHRRYDEDVHRNNGHGGPGYEDVTGGGGGDGDGDGETDADDDYNDDVDGGGSDEGYFRFPVDDKPKRGAVKQYEKKADPHRPLAPAYYAADAASENGMRLDTTLLRGETIELPTYVNVPVTLKCRFEPVDGTVDKFDTVVEAMYPGHRDAPPPPPSSHASRILKQLMGSVEGWRGVTHNSGRSVRRAPGNRFGRREWPARDDEVSDGSPTMESDDQVPWNILARQRAAERMRRIHDSRQDFYWPEWFQKQSARLLHPVAERKPSENQLIEDQEAKQDVYEVAQVNDQQVDGRQTEQVDGQEAEQVYDQQVDGQQIEQGYDHQVDGRQAEQDYDREVEPHIYDLQQVESVDDSKEVESVDDSKQIESVDDSQQIERLDDSQQVERINDQLQVERINDQLQLDGRQVERTEDRAAAEEVDDRHAQGGSLPVKGQQLQLDMEETIAPETTTAVVSDFAKFRKGIPVRTYVEHAYTTDTTL